MSNTFIDTVPIPNSTSLDHTANIGPVQQNTGSVTPQDPYDDSEDESLCPVATSLLDLYEASKTTGRTQATSLLDLFAARKTW